jgi:hypothetical protein
LVVLWAVVLIFALPPDWTISNYLFPKECLTGMILGCQITAFNMALILKWLQQRRSPVILYQAFKATDTLAVRIQKIATIGRV